MCIEFTLQFDQYNQTHENNRQWTRIIIYEYFIALLFHLLIETMPIELMRLKLVESLKLVPRELFPSNLIVYFQIH